MKALKGGHTRTESHFWNSLPLHSALELKQFLRSHEGEVAGMCLVGA